MKRACSSLRLSVVSVVPLSPLSPHLSLSRPRRFWTCLSAARCTPGNRPVRSPTARRGRNCQACCRAGRRCWTSPEGLTSTLQVMLALTVLSLAPAVLLMTTCFVRIVVVLSLLRQALGTQQLPPSQVITSIALFLTLADHVAGLEAGLRRGRSSPTREQQIGLEEAWTAGGPAGATIHEHADRAHRQQRRRVAVPAITCPTRRTPAELRRRAAARPCCRPSCSAS